MRLCWQAGRLDWNVVEQELTPQQMDGWLQFFRLEPQGMESLRVLIADAVSHLCATKGMEVNRTDLLPELREAEQAQEQRQTQADIDASVSQFLGAWKAKGAKDER